jgi:hypothetical protein
MKNRSATFTIIVFALGCFALLPIAQAVVPPPDGGYPGGNTAEGVSALASLSTGGFNTAVGFLSLKSNTEGQFNTAVGAGALLANLGNPSTSDGVENTATGAGALLSNTTGEENTANGAFALFSNTEGVGNTANGDQALFSNTNGTGNTASGSSALSSNTSGSENTATGNFALLRNTIGGFNTAIGGEALIDNTEGSSNTATGAFSLHSNTTGHDNMASGLQALSNNTTGNFNTAVGRDALGNNTTGTGNIALGSEAGSNVSDANNVICIGHPGLNVDNSCFIGNIRDAQVGNNAIAVSIDSFGKLGTMTSSQRFKTEIQPMDKGSEAILALKPVTFHYKSDNTNTPQFGLIAEEVVEVDRDLVVRDKEGKPFSVRYDQVNAMLLNEFLKEHKKVQAHQATITELKSIVALQQRGMKVLAAHLKEQATRIQKVSARLETSKPKTRVVLNNP